MIDNGEIHVRELQSPRKMRNSQVTTLIGALTRFEFSTNPDFHKFESQVDLFRVIDNCFECQELPGQVTPVEAKSIIDEFWQNMSQSVDTPHAHYIDLIAIGASNILV